MRRICCAMAVRYRFLRSMMASSSAWLQRLSTFTLTNHRNCGSMKSVPHHRDEMKELAGGSYKR